MFTKFRNIEPDDDKQQDSDKKPKISRKLFLRILAANLIFTGLFMFLFGGGDAVDCERNYSELNALISSGDVARIEMLDASNTLKLYYDSEAEAESGCEFITVKHAETMEESIIGKLDASGIPYEIMGAGAGSALLNLLPILIIFGFLIFIMRKGAGGMMGGFIKNPLKRNKGKIPNVKYDDIQGIDEVVEEIKEIQDFLERPDRYVSKGAKIPKGVLLVGDPGTGKTLLAQAVAGEAGVPFLSMSGSDFVEMFVGVGAKRMRSLFEEAKKNAPAIIFIDEIDAVGKHRGNGMGGGGNDEREQTLNALLVEMDGFDDSDTVIVMAATNRGDVLDPALLRPGRFDRQITVPAPDRAGRVKILEVHTKGKPLASDIDFDRLAQDTAGFTGADLANLANEAALLTARKNLEIISTQEFEEAFDRVVMKSPARKNRLRSDEEQKIVSYHEAGHAIVGYVLPDADPVSKITIVAHGDAGGFTMSTPEEDRTLYKRKMLLDKLASLYGGRVAEELILGKDDFSTGAFDDIEKATGIARRMVTEFGMSEKLGPIKYAPQQGTYETAAGIKPYGSITQEWIDEEVRAIVEMVKTEAAAIILEHEDVLHKIAEYLMEHETIFRDDVEKIFGKELKNSWEREWKLEK